MSVSNRPFTLFYGESAKFLVFAENYHVRSRASSVTAATRAAIARIHLQGDAARVDIYDQDMYHCATVRKVKSCIEVSFSD
jgi:hypothetical protein